MAFKPNPPWLGVAIPCFLIAFIGYGSHYFVFTTLSIASQLWFQFFLGMIWVSYYMAIFTPPGAPPANFVPPKHTWKRWCSKCNNYKPERSHHCKTCKQCVLLMDHHCPWTLNCVGFQNMAPFMRFLFWVALSATFILWHIVAMVMEMWNLPGYLVSKGQIISMIVFFMLGLFIFATIMSLVVRCLINWGFKGMTQIESWEWDRVENLHWNSTLLTVLAKNYKEMYGEELPQADFSRAPLECLVMFPYDNGIFTNLSLVMGPWYQWLWPWGGPTGSGAVFETDVETDSVEDKLLSIPWPVDSGHVYEDGERVVRDPRVKLDRKQWYNNYGEHLSDFGVDVDDEDTQVLQK